jgi:antitoxin YefM
LNQTESDDNSSAADEDLEAERNGTLLMHEVRQNLVRWSLESLICISRAVSSVKDQDVVIVRRRRGGDVALIPASELAGLIETAHLLRSPKNARRLLRALNRAKRGTLKPESVDQLRREMPLEQSG